MSSFLVDFSYRRRHLHCRCGNFPCPARTTFWKFIVPSPGNLFFQHVNDCEKISSQEFFHGPVQVMITGGQIRPDTCTIKSLRGCELANHGVACIPLKPWLNGAWPGLYASFWRVERLVGRLVVLVNGPTGPPVITICSRTCKNPCEDATFHSLMSWKHLSRIRCDALPKRGSGMA